MNKEDPKSAFVQASGSAQFLFDPKVLAKAVMLPTEAAKFRSEAKRYSNYCPDTGAGIVAYFHRDGRVLIDAMLLPNNQMSGRAAQKGDNE